MYYSLTGLLMYLVCTLQGWGDVGYNTKYKYQHPSYQYNWTVLFLPCVARRTLLGCLPAAGCQLPAASSCRA